MSLATGDAGGLTDMMLLILILQGALAGALTAVLVARLAPSWYREVLAVFLAVIAALYAGPEIDAGRLFSLELGFATILIILSIVALRAPLWLLALGYLLHGLWDMLHGAVLPHVMPPWYAPLCIGYDITLAVFIFVKYRRSAALAAA